MFTGIIEEVGRVRSVRRGNVSAAIEIEASTVLEGTKPGDSIATNGVCLTVTSLTPNTYTADVMHETLRRSSLGELNPGSPVNLERALQVGGRLGGHIVSGHIDGCGTIERIEEDGNAVWYTIGAKPHVMRYIVEKGSIAIDGISLTVASVSPARFQVSVIPHTRAQTNLASKAPGATVNLECDVLGKYVEKLMGTPSIGAADSSGSDCGDGGLTMEALAMLG